MPRSRSPSPHTKSSRHPPKKSSDKYRSRSRRSRSPSSSSKPHHKSRHLSPSEHSRSRRSRSPSSKHRRTSRSPSKYQKSSSSRNKSYATSTRRRSRSRDSQHRHHKSSKGHRRRRRDSSSTSSSSTSSSTTSTTSRSSSAGSRSKSPDQAPNSFIPLIKEHPPRLSTKRVPISPPGRSTTTFASVDQLLDDPIMPDTLDHINAEGFVSRTFVSKKTTTSDKVIIDLERETITVSGAKDKDVEEIDPIFYPNCFVDDPGRMEKWVKKLFVYRQRAFLG